MSRQREREIGTTESCALVGCLVIPFYLIIYIIGVMLSVAFWLVVIILLLAGIEALGADLTWFEFSGFENPFN